MWAVHTSRSWNYANSDTPVLLYFACHIGASTQLFWGWSVVVSRRPTHHHMFCEHSHAYHWNSDMNLSPAAAIDWKRDCRCGCSCGIFSNAWSYAYIKIHRAIVCMSALSAACYIQDRNEIMHFTVFTWLQLFGVIQPDIWQWAFIECVLRFPFKLLLPSCQGGQSSDLFLLKLTRMQTMISHSCTVSSMICIFEIINTWQTPVGKHWIQLRKLCSQAMLVEFVALVVLIVQKWCTVWLSCDLINYRW